MTDEYRRVFASAPPARATTIAALMNDAASVEITLVASALPKVVFGAAASGRLPGPMAVRAGQFTFLSGIEGNTPENAGDIAAQTAEMLARVDGALGTMGLSFADCVEATTSLADCRQVADVARVFTEKMPVRRPAGVMVGSALPAASALIATSVIAWK
jgi:enamine deaminase RidA (YjgF/YER057c/UK114 family)